MSSTLPQTRYTPDDLLRHPEESRFELVDGQLVERHMGSKSGCIEARICRHLDVYVEDNQLGWVFGSEGGYRCFADDPDKVRRPDASFVAKGRLPQGVPSEGYETVPPDLAVEVVSPRDHATGLDEKIEEYLQAGVRLVWVVYPSTRSVEVRRRDGSITKLHDQDVLDGEDVLPGFHLAIRRQFPVPESIP